MYFLHRLDIFLFIYLQDSIFILIFAVSKLIKQITDMEYTDFINTFNELKEAESRVYHCANKVIAKVLESTTEGQIIYEMDLDDVSPLCDNDGIWIESIEHCDGEITYTLDGVRTESITELIDGAYLRVIRYLFKWLEENIKNN